VFWRFVIRALEYRRQRLLLAFSALVVAATLATVLFGIYGTVERRFRDEFRSYGANIAAVPLSGKTVPLAIAAAAEKLGAEAAPFLITSGVTSGRTGAQTVAVAGFVPAKSAQLTSYWHMQGSRDIGAGECIAGEFIASRLGVKPGATIALQGAPCVVKGIVSTGGGEDQEILVPFETAAMLAGVHDAASVIEIRAPGGREEEIRSALAREFPAADVRTNLAVTETEESVVFKIRASLFLLTLLILVITTLCVSSNFSELVIERSKEIGILKALGGAEKKIAAFFVSESAVIALAATVAGYAVGVFAAAGIGREVFGGVFRLAPSWGVLGGVAGVMLAVAGIATAIAASRIWSIQPATILRGE
jgi:putative ABC transport system permease protein